MGKRKPVIQVQIESNDMLGRLNILAEELDRSLDYLINTAIRRLLDDVDEIRSMRNIRPVRPK